MTQAFVGQYKGAGQLEKIGPCVWQMIWFSLMTMLITWPLGEFVGTLFFRATTVPEGRLCFHYLMAFNFLFPLGAVISAFYLGQGQAKRVLCASLIGHGLHLLLDFPLIFGIKGIIPPQGALGSIWASLVAQLLFCTVLFVDFVKVKHQLYCTRDFVFRGVAFWRYIRWGVPRAVARIVQLGAWIIAVRIMITKGGDYAAVLAFGGTLQLFLSCLQEGLSQALTSRGAYLVGASQPLIWKLARSAFWFLGLECLLLSIPLLFFPETLIALFFKQEPSAVLRESLCLTSYWMWVVFLAEGLNMIGFGLSSAYGDTIFQMRFSIAVWVHSLLPTYLCIQRGEARPDLFWLIMAVGGFVGAAIYFLRLRQEKWIAIPQAHYFQDIK
jgi:MATE family multidrug resistance protein